MVATDLSALDAPELDKLLFCRPPDIISTELDGETVILDIKVGEYSGLDPVGTTIWNLMEKPVSFAEMVNVVLEKFDVAKQQCTDDLVEFLNSLAENNLIVVQADENQ